MAKSVKMMILQAIALIIWIGMMNALTVYSITSRVLVCNRKGYEFTIKQVCDLKKLKTLEKLPPRDEMAMTPMPESEWIPFFLEKLAPKPTKH